ncbi:MAG: lamin tail domain-containing protein [Candidatus Eiseniibacteriota bacterium]|jgi:hypothetical protein
MLRTGNALGRFRVVRCGACRKLAGPLASCTLILMATLMAARPPVGQARDLTGLVLNEVLADPARDWDGDGEISSTNDEWVEVYNRGPDTVVLDGYRIGDLDRSWAYGFSGSLQAEQRVVVYGSTSKAWQVAHGEGAYGLRLSNMGDTVALWHIAGADTVLVDTVAYENHEADDDRSSGRRPDGAELWELFDGLNAYNGTTPPPGNGCIPTPDATNNCVTPVEEATWGAVKAQHR